jgi:hypothetical protein
MPDVSNNANKVLLLCKEIDREINDVKTEAVVYRVAEQLGDFSDVSYEDYYGAMQIVKKLSEVVLHENLSETIEKWTEYYKNLQYSLVCDWDLPNPPFPINKEEHDRVELLYYNRFLSILFCYVYKELHNDQIDQVYNCAKILIKDEKLLKLLWYQIRFMKDRNDRKDKDSPIEHK